MYMRAALSEWSELFKKKKEDMSREVGVLGVDQGGLEEGNVDGNDT